MTVLIAAIGGLAGLVLLALTVRRPIFGCGALVLVAPLTAGLARGAVLPLLKPSEALVLIVLAGVVINHMSIRRTRPITGLDLAIGGYVIGSVVIPWLVLWLTHYPVDVDTWRTVVSPALFGVVYYIYSRTELADGSLRTVLNLAMLAGVLVSLIAAAELVNVPGVRDIVSFYYPGPTLSAFRPGSTLGHYSAVGAFGALTYILALSLAATQSEGFSRWWLTAVMGISALGVIVSQTWAPLAALPVATAVLLIYARRVPRELVFTAFAGLLAMVVLWPLISARFDSQHLVTVQGFALPESMQTRIRYWSEFIVPALSDHLWVGTGTVIPSTVPAHLTTFVDNEYLWAAFRAGWAGVALLLGMLAAMMAVGWTMRFSSDSTQRSIGAAAGATAVILILLGATAQYITFAGLSQEIAMLVGVLAGLTVSKRAHSAPVIVISQRRASSWMQFRSREIPPL